MTEQKNLISRIELCQVTGVSYNELVQQFRRGDSSRARPTTPLCIGKDGHNQLYERDAAIEWVHYWRSGEHKKRLQAQSPKLMILNVKRKKLKKTVQTLDNLKIQVYSQHIRE